MKDTKLHIPSLAELRIQRSLAEQGSPLVSPLLPEFLDVVTQDYANGRVKVHRNPNDRFVRSQRIDAELGDGKVSFGRYSAKTGFIVLPASLSYVRVFPNNGREDALVVLEGRGDWRKSYSFEDRDGRKVGWAFGGDNIEMAILNDLGTEDPRISELAKRIFVSPEIIKWIRLRLVFGQ